MQNHDQYAPLQPQSRPYATRNHTPDEQPQNPAPRPTGNINPRILFPEDERHHAPVVFSNTARFVAPRHAEAPNQNPGRPTV